VSFGSSLDVFCEGRSISGLISIFSYSSVFFFPFLDLVPSQTR